MNLGDVLNWIYNNWADIFNLATQTVGAFAIIASMTPNRADDRIVQTVLDLLNFGAFNFGQAKNRS
jgi:hypothetical protein